MAGNDPRRPTDMMSEHSPGEPDATRNDPETRHLPAARHVTRPRETLVTTDESRVRDPRATRVAFTVNPGRAVTTLAVELT